MFIASKAVLYVKVSQKMKAVNQNDLEDWYSNYSAILSPSLIFWPIFAFNMAVEHVKNMWITQVLVIFQYSMKMKALEQKWRRILDLPLRGVPICSDRERA